MPIELAAECAVLRDKCRLEDAEALREWLQLHPQCEIDLAHCTQLHTGILQIILIHGRPLAAPPTDAAFARWLSHYIDHYIEKSSE